MSHDEFGHNVISNDREMRPSTKSQNVWGVAMYATAPWPQKMCIEDYDAGELDDGSDGTKTVRFDVENGFAVYRIIGRCEHGCAYHGILLQSLYQPLPEMAA